ncbi:MAG: response regulator, partial [Pseudomonadota bacterium]
MSSPLFDKQIRRARKKAQFGEELTQRLRVGSTKIDFFGDAMSTAQAGSGANLSTLIAPHLPYLRRYARSLTGTQTLGDGLVAKTIEALIDDRDVMDHSLGPRVGLYRLFTKIWAETPVETNAAVQLGPTPRSRQILLLTAVESFTLDDAALVLDVGVDKAEALKREGVEKLKQARHATVLIIEDEPIIALDIEGIVRGMGHDVVGVADTHSEAVRMAAETSPDLILADIQLADGSSGV